MLTAGDLGPHDKAVGVETGSHCLSGLQSPVTLARFVPAIGIGEGILLPVDAAEAVLDRAT